MGTKVHFRSYFPGHDKMRDLNADVGNHFPSFYISNTLNEHLYNGCLPSSSTGQSEFDKEMLKRTILEHEAIFRRQVYELHRLYGIQKDLMVELQNNALSAISELKVPSKTISCSSQVQSGFATRMWQMPHPFVMKNYQKRGNPGYNDDIIYPVKLPEVNLRSSSGFFETNSVQKVAERDSSFRKCPNSMLDFRLPAKKSEIPFSSPLNTSTSRICTEDSDIELKLNLIGVSGSSGKGVCKLNCLYNKSLFTGLADLNDPNRQASLDGIPNSFPDMFFGSKTITEENHRLKYPLSSTTLSMQNAFTNDGDCGGERASSNVFQGVKEEISRGAVCHNEAEHFPVISHKGKNYILCEQAKLNVNNVSSVNSIDHNEASTQFGHEQNHHFLIPGKFPEHSESGNLGKPTSVFSNPFSSSLKQENKLTSVPIVPTWMKFSSHENLFSEISNASDISIRDPNDSSGSWRVGIDLKSPLKFEDKCSSSHLDDLNVGLQSASQKKFPFANINLNAEAENSFYGTQDGQTSPQNKATKNINGKYEDLLPEPSCLKRRPACASLEPPQVDLEFSRMNQVYQKKSDDLASLSSRNFYACSSLLKTEIKVQTDQPSDSSSRMKFIASYSDKLQEKSSSPSNEEKLAIDELKHVGMSHDIIMYSSEKSATSENNKRNSRNSIDLNSVFPFEDSSDSSENSAEVLADPPSLHSDPISVSEVVPLIDLEAHVMILEENTPTFQQELCSAETNIKEAAENIVKLSQDNFKLNKEIEIYSSPTPPDNNTLYTFAEMILSNNNIIESHPYVELDLFEQMTLQLEEIKPEKSCPKPHEAAENDQTNVSKALLLLAKPRKAQGKKRRQKRDFQKDILPALATLSRQESMEDLQTIGELMKASGSPWQAGIRRRNMRQNGAKAQAIRKSRVEIKPPTTFFIVDGENYNPELEVEKHHMIGWGRTTRRCRSQRCPSVSFSSTLM